MNINIIWKTNINRKRPLWIIEGNGHSEQGLDRYS